MNLSKAYGLSNQRPNSDWLYILQLGFRFRSHSTPRGAIVVPRSCLRYSNLDENTKVRLAKLEH